MSTEIGRVSMKERRRRVLERREEKRREESSTMLSERDLMISLESIEGIYRSQKASWRVEWTR